MVVESRMRRRNGSRRWKMRKRVTGGGYWIEVRGEGDDEEEAPTGRREEVVARLVPSSTCVLVSPGRRIAGAVIHKSFVDAAS